ncbi:metabotropic glutamate receptor 1-like protein 2 [Leptotrombidium deliense]|uniref:Metabotropic glutamate receptor 1-like protein 2 n=1 Tax=Leptotrombidium deliense TaxID=299467 RepID=A0A443SFZ1_9ACAR|nr:metabotropic glutamate receptor 1-like protein 2 [Leptotrombidium deliense]
MFERVYVKHSNYGSSLMEVFKGLAQEARICIANTESVNNNDEDGTVDEVFKSLLKYSSTARVVACFCEGMTVRNILKAIRRWNATGELLLVGSDGWSDRPDVVEGFEHEAVGGISVRIDSPYVQEFDSYYFNLNPENNTRNPWFQEFWEFKFNCSLPLKTRSEATRMQSLNQYNRTCTGLSKFVASLIIACIYCRQQQIYNSHAIRVT